YLGRRIRAEPGQEDRGRRRSCREEPDPDDAEDPAAEGRAAIRRRRRRARDRDHPRPSPPEHRAAAQGGEPMMMRCEGSTLVRLPPPLRGRVGERGKPRARRSMSTSLSQGRSRLVETDVERARRVAPLSLALARKGGGNPSARTSLTEGKAIVRSTSA